MRHLFASKIRHDGHVRGVAWRGSRAKRYGGGGGGGGGSDASDWTEKRSTSDDGTAPGTDLGSRGRRRSCSRACRPASPSRAGSTSRTACASAEGDDDGGWRGRAGRVSEDVDGPEEGLGLGWWRRRDARWRDGATTTTTTRETTRLVLLERAQDGDAPGRVRGRGGRHDGQRDERGAV